MHLLRKHVDPAAHATSVLWITPQGWLAVVMSICAHCRVKTLQ
jgi:hypothetical protein